VTYSTPSQNTLDLAKQGDPEAIARILTYHLTQRYNMTASVIRLGDYLSVLVEAGFVPESGPMVQLVQEIVQSLGIEGITTIEISARQISGGEVLWSQTIEVHSEHFSALMNDETSSPSISASSTPTPQESAPTRSAEVAIVNPLQPETAPPSAHTEATTPLPPAPAVSPTSHPIPAVTAASMPSLLTQSLPDAESQDDEWSEVLKKVVQRPEMLAVVAFALVVVLWDTYVEWMTEADPSQPLSATKLARRLGVTNSTLASYKYRPNFNTWSQDLDPDGIAWSYEGNKFVAKIPL
jgi:hypothetical protein